MDRAGAALAVVATFLCAGKPQMFSHAIEQRRAGIDIQFVVGAVDVQSDMYVGTIRAQVGDWCFTRISTAGSCVCDRGKLSGANRDAGGTHAAQERSTCHALEHRLSIILARAWFPGLFVHESNSPLNYGSGTAAHCVVPCPIDLSFLTPAI